MEETEMDMETAFLLGDQPTTCPSCGARTEFQVVEGKTPYTEEHYCRECDATTIFEEDDEEEDDITRYDLVSFNGEVVGQVLIKNSADGVSRYHNPPAPKATLMMDSAKLNTLKQFQALAREVRDASTGVWSLNMVDQVAYHDSYQAFLDMEL